MLPNIDIGQIQNDCLNFLPEFLACGGIVLILLMRLFDRSHMGNTALVVTLTALGISLSQWYGKVVIPWPENLWPFYGDYVLNPFEAPMLPSATGNFRGAFHTAFGSLVVYDHLTIYLRCFLYGFTALIIWLSKTTGIPDREDSADFYCLLLGATVGMVMMAASTHLLMVYIGVEMASLPSYALAGYLKGRRASGEAALKYVVYGGGASGVMLYGISLLAGRFGTAYLPEVAIGLMYQFHSSSGTLVFDPVLILGVLFVLIGVGFKLAAVPFHFWCPDVFEGAAAEVAGFLSVASKGAALALLARLTLLLTGIDNMDQALVTPHWGTMVRYLVPVLAFFAALTATFGNLAAYLQTNLKRLLAYSTIAHAGYMMMGIAALKPVEGSPDAFEMPGLQAVLFYLAAYLFMNLGAFAVVAYLRNETGSEELDDYRGLIRRSPWMVVTLSIFLLSLLGIPPLVGFAAKFQVFSVLWSTSQAWYRHGDAGLGAILFGLLIVGGVNTVISAMYYVKVMKVMILEGKAEDLEGREPVRLREPISAVFYSFILALAVIVLGILWVPDRYSHEATDRFTALSRAAPKGAAGMMKGKAKGGKGPPGGGKKGGPGGKQQKQQRPQNPGLPPQPPPPGAPKGNPQ
jgi:NADH-quinone oxidoreductase subunit N